MRGFSRPDAYVSMRWGHGLRVDRVCLNDTPEFMRGLRLLFAADLHVRKSVTDSQLEDFFALAEAQRADMVLLGGDFAEGEEQHARVFRMLSRLKPPLGIYACPGNNDRETFARHREFYRLAASSGIRLLENRTCEAPYGGGRILVAGVDDHMYGAPNYRRLFPGNRQNTYRLLLSHYPVLPEDGCAPDCMLCGHTHGGQLNFCGVTPYTLGLVDRKQLPGGPVLAAGSARIGQMRLLVSRGVGCSRMPLRVGVRPEIHLLECTENLC